MRLPRIRRVVAWFALATFTAAVASAQTAIVTRASKPQIERGREVAGMVAGPTLAGHPHEVGVTALSCWSLLIGGVSPRIAPRRYRPLNQELRRTLTALLRLQNTETGRFGDGDIVEHALATQTLATWASIADEKRSPNAHPLRRRAGLAVKALLDARGPSGRWTSDVEHSTAWILLALGISKLHGIDVDHGLFDESLASLPDGPRLHALRHLAANAWPDTASAPMPPDRPYDVDFDGPLDEILWSGWAAMESPRHVFKPWEKALATSALITQRNEAPVAADRSIFGTRDDAQALRELIVSLFFRCAYPLTQVKAADLR